MKSFDILVDGRLIQSDLIVVNLPVHNDIAAYYWLNIDSSLVNHIIAEKAVSPVESTGGIALTAYVDDGITKYETVKFDQIVLDASSEFEVHYMLNLENGTITEIQQCLQEVSQKIESAHSQISIGVGDALDAMPLKTVGDVENNVELGAGVSELKNAVIVSRNDSEGLAIGLSLNDPFSVYYEKADGKTVFDTSVKSLSYLRYMRFIQNNTSIDAKCIDFDLFRSLGRFNSRFSVGADARLAVEFFTDANSAADLISTAEISQNKFINAESDFSVACTGYAILRYMRLLSSVDAFGNLVDIDEMTLDDLDYTDTNTTPEGTSMLGVAILGDMKLGGG